MRTELVSSGQNGIALGSRFRNNQAHLGGSAGGRRNGLSGLAVPKSAWRKFHLDVASEFRENRFEHPHSSSQESSRVLCFQCKH